MFNWFKRSKQPKVAPKAPAKPVPMPASIPFVAYNSLTEANLLEVLLPYFPEELQAQFLLTRSPFYLEKALLRETPIIGFKDRDQYVYLSMRMEKANICVSSNPHSASCLGALTSIHNGIHWNRTQDPTAFQNVHDTYPVDFVYTALPPERAYKAFAEVVTRVLKGTYVDTNKHLRRS